MGKKQHQKDKLYLTATEWRTLYGGKRANDEYHTHNEQLEFKRLPFNCCSLSLQLFRDPYCTSSGVIYDITSIIPFIQKFNIDPYSGEKLEIKQLIKLNFKRSSNAEFSYECPILFKVFNENTHIVAIKTTGNVFSYEAVRELNLEANNFRDLINDEPFTKKDIIEIQNPLNLKKFNINDFYYVKNNLTLDEAEQDKSNLRVVNNETRETLKELSTVEENKFLKNLAKSQNPKTETNAEIDKFNVSSFSTGRAAASFTSTVMPLVSKVEAALVNEYEIRYPYIKKKGYVRLVTNFGNLNLELYCDKVPKTCDNFVQLCNRGYYDGTKFHRLIRNFMIQGGDPTGTGRGGDSIFDGPFEDEINKLYSHEGRGVLSMANSGPNTNKSQFFITFRSCKHLDKKHTIFGRVVGGMDVLSRIEVVKTDEKDKPLDDISIQNAIVFVDPYKEADEKVKNEREKLKESEEKSRLKRESRTKNSSEKTFRKGVGAFINLNQLATKDEDKNDNHSNESSNKRKKLIQSSFGSFDSW